MKRPNKNNEKYNVFNQLKYNKDLESYINHLEGGSETNTLVEFLEWQKKNYNEVYLYSADFQVETYLKTKQ